MTNFRLLLFGLFILGCGKEPAPTQEPPSLSSDNLSRVTELGPVKATVTLSPSNPVVGDKLVLTIQVDAPDDVLITMPEYGDALGQFHLYPSGIREKTRHQYVLRSPMSGTYRIPQMRIVFSDERADATTSEPTELLTDEISFQVQSANIGEQQELAPAPGELPPHRTVLHWTTLLALGGGACVLLLLLWLWKKRANPHSQSIDPYQFATERLKTIESHGLPSKNAVESWYVQLSETVRRYIELRFQLNAPEQTTEEFLTSASQKGVLAQEHQTLLSTFLSHCDQVKFARHEPTDDESQKALDFAWQFVRETKPMEETP